MPELTIDNLFEQWRSRPATPMPVENYRSLGKLANAKGEYLLAFDIGHEGLATHPGDKVLRQAMALALARMGSFGRARGMLEQIRNEGHDDEETLGILARTYKDVWLRTGSTQDLTAAFEAYLAAYRGRPEHYWTGINAATLAFALQDHERSTQLAKDVLASCDSARGSQQPDYWVTATAAEAELLLNNVASAEQLYSEARRTGNLGDLLSTWRNACIILRLRPSVRPRIERAFHPPKVGVRVGAPSDQAQQLSAAMEGGGVGIAYSSPESGGGIEFLEAIRSAGGQIHFVLPYNEAEFVKEQTALAGDDWRNRYDKLRGQPRKSSYVQSRSLSSRALVQSTRAT